MVKRLPSRLNPTLEPLLLQVRVQLIKYDLIQLHSDRLEFDLGYNFFRKSVRQQAAP
jgi:hypothetical protein